MPMQFQKLQLRPGVNRQTTNYANGGGWWDCDKVRFQNGVPEKIGGWSKFTKAAADGTIRQIRKFRTLSGTVYTAVGTTHRLYLERGQALYDITPLRATSSLGTDPLDADSGSTTVTVNDTGHGAFVGDHVEISGATTFAGIPADELNAVHHITNVVDANSYEIEVTTSATSTASGGGASVQAEYYIHTGADSVTFGDGWGAGSWGRNTWGSAADVSVEVGGGFIRLWSFANYGEDLLSCYTNGPIFYWDATTGDGVRAFDIGDLPGATDAPQVAIGVIVSERDRHIIAFGCDPIDNPGVQDPLLIRWSDQEDAGNWTPSTTSTSGSIKLGRGSRIIGFKQTRQETLVWTDQAVYALRWVGGIFVFGVVLISEGTTLIGQNAAVSTGDMVYWMSNGSFYIYEGSVRRIPCDVKDYIFENMNQDQAVKVYASTNIEHGEAIWFYPSTTMEENDSYVVLNFIEGIWYYGTLPRTAWIDVGLSEYPIGAGSDGFLYYHEIGYEDGSTTPPSRILAHIESSPLEIGDGYRYGFVKRLIPDVTFDSRATASSPNVNFVLKMRNAPGGDVTNSTEETVTRTATIPVEQYDEEKWVRLRGRSMIIRVEDPDDGNTSVSWRLGAPRISLRTDGRR